MAERERAMRTRFSAVERRWSREKVERFSAAAVASIRGGVVLRVIESEGLFESTDRDRSEFVWWRGFFN